MQNGKVSTTWRATTRRVTPKARVDTNDEGFQTQESALGVGEPRLHATTAHGALTGTIAQERAKDQGRDHRIHQGPEQIGKMRHALRGLARSPSSCLAPPNKRSDIVAAWPQLVWRGGMGWSRGVAKPQRPMRYGWALATPAEVFVILVARSDQRHGLRALTHRAGIRGCTPHRRLAYPTQACETPTRRGAVEGLRLLDARNRGRARGALSWHRASGLRRCDPCLGPGRGAMMSSAWPLSGTMSSPNRHCLCSQTKLLSWPAQQRALRRDA